MMSGGSPRDYFLPDCSCSLPCSLLILSPTLSLPSLHSLRALCSSLSLSRLPYTLHQPPTLTPTVQYTNKLPTPLVIQLVKAQ